MTPCLLDARASLLSFYSHTPSHPEFLRPSQLQQGQEFTGLLDLLGWRGNLLRGNIKYLKSSLAICTYIHISVDIFQHVSIYFHLHNLHEHRLHTFAYIQSQSNDIGCPKFSVRSVLIILLNALNYKQWSKLYELTK